MRACGPTSWTTGAPGAIACFGVEHRGKHLVVHHEPPAAFLRGGFAVGDDGGDPLAGKAHDVVEDDGVVGVVAVMLVARGGEAAGRRVLPGEHRNDPGNGERVLLADRQDAGVGMGRAQQLECSRPSTAMSKV